MNTFTISFPILILTLIACKIVGERALKQLSTEEKGTLLGSFSSYSISAIFVSFALVFAYIIGANYFWQSSATSALIFIVLFFAVSGTISVLSYRKLKSLNMPESYIKSFLLLLGIQYVAFVAMLLPMAWKP